MTTEVKPLQEGTEEVKPKGSPNDDYKNNPLLDEKGNPKPEPSSKDETKPVEEVKTEPAEKEPEKKDTTDWSQLEGVKKLEKFLVDAGLTPSAVTKDVIENGGKITPDLLKTLEDKYGAGVAALITDQVLDLYRRGQERVKADETAIFKLVADEFKDLTQQDGSATFEELKSWAKENVDNDKRKELNKLLAAGGFQAELAVKYLAATFKGSNTFESPASLVTADNVSNSSTLTPITRAQYRDELDKLVSKGYSDTSPEVQKLHRARELGMKRKI